MALILETSRIDGYVLNTIQKLGLYCGLDSCMTQEIFSKLREELTPIFKKTYDFSISQIPVALFMMEKGVKWDSKAANRHIENLEKTRLRLEILLLRIALITGNDKFNPRSVSQLKEFLYGTPSKGGSGFDLPKQYKKNDKNVVILNTDKDALKAIKKSSIRGKIISSLLLTLRKIEKRLAFLTCTLEENDRFRVSFNIAGTETGRWSSSKNVFNRCWNAQNVEKKDGGLRDVFIPDPGYKFFYPDLKSAESFAVAYMSGDEKYIEACESGDIHTTVAHLAYKIPLDRKEADRIYIMGKSYRDLCKPLGHGTNYLGSPFGLCQQTGLPKKEIELFQEKYFGAFKGIGEWHRNVAKELQETSCLTTPLGRCRYFWGRTNEDSTLRQAVAFLGQFIGDIINIGLINLYENKSEHMMPLFQIHDAILGQVRENMVDFYKPFIVSCLRVPVKIKGRIMNIPVDVKFGNNWKEIS